MRLATLNVWGHPDLIGRHGQQRMQAIAAALPDLGCDVVAFQEVWRLEWREILVEGARRAGFEHIWTNVPTLGGSGLLLVSRLPLRDARFHPYRLRGLPQRFHHGDYYSGKGFVTVRVDGEAGPVTVLNTHLHAQYAADADDDYFGMRAAQVVEIAAALATVEDPIVALGDFNLSEPDPEYAMLAGLSGLRDAAAQLDRRQPTVLANHPYRDGGRGPEGRIDYAFVRDGRRAGARALGVDRVFDEPLEFGGETGAYSDHAGVRIDVAFASGEGRPLAPPTAHAVALAQDALAAGRAEAQARRRFERGVAGVGAGVGLAAVAGARNARVERRGFLRAGLWTLAGLAVGGAIGAGVLSEAFVPPELEGFDAVEADLQALAAGERSPNARFP